MSRQEGTRPRKRIALLTLVVLLLALVLLAFGAARADWREWQEDLYLDIPQRQAQLIVREWGFLLGSGAELYYQEEGRPRVRLDGNLPGGDDGYQPFSRGEYQVEFTPDGCVLRWFVGITTGTDEGWMERAYTFPT